MSKPAQFARLRPVFRWAGWAAVIVIVILSVMPGPSRPHSGWAGSVEHFAAYALTALALSIGYPAMLARIGVVLTLTSLSGLLEFAQTLVPGRRAALADVLVSGLGASAGVGLALLLFAVLARSRVGRSGS